MSTGRQNCIWTSSSREPLEPDSEPMQVVVRCSLSGFRLLTVLCVGSGGGEERKGMWGCVGCWPSEEVAGGLVRTVLC